MLRGIRSTGRCCSAPPPARTCRRIVSPTFLWRCQPSAALPPPGLLRIQPRGLSRLPQACGARLELALDVDELAAGACDHDAPRRARPRRVPLPRYPTAATLPRWPARAGATRRCGCWLAAASSLSRPRAAHWPGCWQRRRPVWRRSTPPPSCAWPSPARPAATAGWSAFDVGALLWEELVAQARGLLAEVHVLARAYGWSEAEVLELSRSRRAAYLAMVAA